MFVVDIKYIVPLSTIDTIVGEHRAWLDIQYQQGLLLCSGPKNPKTGGIVIALGTDLEFVKNLFKQDPYSVHGAAEYSFTEFTPVKHHAQIQNLVG